MKLFADGFDECLFQIHASQRHQNGQQIAGQVQSLRGFFFGKAEQEIAQQGGLARAGIAEDDQAIVFLIRGKLHGFFDG